MQGKSLCFLSWGQRRVHGTRTAVLPYIRRQEAALPRPSLLSFARVRMLARKTNEAERPCMLLRTGRNLRTCSSCLTQEQRSTRTAMPWGLPCTRAAWRNGLKSVKVLLGAGADPNVVDREGKTPLHKAAGSGPAEMVLALIEAGADPNARDDLESTPLSDLSGEDDFEKAIALLGNGADPNARSTLGGTPLHSIAFGGSPKAISALIEAGADINARDDLGRTPLAVAKQSAVELKGLTKAYGSEFDNSKSIDVLLQAGAEHETSDDQSVLPFNPLRAMHEVFGEAGPELLGQMPPVPCADWSEDIFFAFASPGNIGRCIDEGASLEGALLRASKSGGPQQIEALLKAGGNVNERDLSGQTPLHLAVEALHAVLAMMSPALTQGSPTTEWHQIRVSRNVAALLAAGADIEARNDGGQTPLHIAAMAATSMHPAELNTLGIGGADEQAQREARALSAIVALLEADASVEARDDNGWTPLHWAAFRGTSEIITAILDTGVPVDPLDAEGVAPLHVAARGKRPSNISTLLDAGSAIDVQDESGETPLHFAAKHATSSEIALLLAAGADVDSRNGSGETPLHLAAQSGTSNGIETLLKAEADPEARDDNGRTPLFAAARRLTVEPVVALIEGRASAEVHDSRGRTPLLEAVGSGGPAGIVGILVAAGADPNERDGFGSTPIFYAFAAEKFSALVAAGASDRRTKREW